MGGPSFEFMKVRIIQCIIIILLAIQSGPGIRRKLDY